MPVGAAQVNGSNYLAFEQSVVRGGLASLEETTSGWSPYVFVTRGLTALTRSEALERDGRVGSAARRLQQWQPAINLVVVALVGGSVEQVSHSVGVHLFSDRVAVALPGPGADSRRRKRPGRTFLSSRRCASTREWSR